MERHEFIKKIIELYPDTFRQDRINHVQAWVDMYEKALPKTWDFDKLMWYFATEYKSTTSPPPPAFFYSFAGNVRPADQPKKWKVERLTPEEEEASRLAKEAFLKNMRKLAEGKKI